MNAQHQGKDAAVVAVEIQQGSSDDEEKKIDNSSLLKEDSLLLAVLSERFSDEDDKEDSVEDHSATKPKHGRVMALLWGLLLAMVALVGMISFLPHAFDSVQSGVVGEPSPESAAEMLEQSNTVTFSPTSITMDQSPVSLTVNPTSAPTLQWEPEQVLATYRAQHSVDALRVDVSTLNTTALMNRKFTVGYYSCPDYAGNLLHDFVNGLLIAVLTNRTFLWAFETNQVNQQGACDELLRAAPWIPSYQEWKHALYLPLPMMVKTKKFVRHYDGQGRFVPLQDAILHANHRALRPHEINDLSEATQQEFWYGDVLLEQERPFEFLSQLFGFENSTFARDLVPRLYANGRAFLFVSVIFSLTECQDTFMNSLIPSPPFFFEILSTGRECSFVNQ